MFIKLGQSLVVTSALHNTRVRIRALTGVDTTADYHKLLDAAPNMWAPHPFARSVMRQAARIRRELCGNRRCSCSYTICVE
jgi:hypothetical protein